MEPLLSFELSVMDIVLAIAIIVILLLQVKKTPTESAAQSKLSREGREPPESLGKNRVKRKTSRTKGLPSHAPEDSTGCWYHFGYLKTLPLGGSVPKECYSCSRMRQCLFSSE